MRNIETQTLDRRGWVLVGRIHMLDELLKAITDPETHSTLRSKRLAEVHKLDELMKLRRDLNGVQLTGVHAA